MGQTETKVAQVTLKSTGNRSKTVSIDNPKDNLSLNQIKSAFQPAIVGGWLLDNYGDTVSEVSEAKYNQVIKTQIEGETVIISPSSINFTDMNQFETTVSVTNATINIAQIVDITDTGTIGDSGSVFNVVISSNTSTSIIITVTTDMPYEAGQVVKGTATLKILFDGATSPVTVPITANIPYTE